MSPMLKFPHALPLKLPCNVIDINASEIGRFSPLRARDISGPVINSHFLKESDNYSKIDITVQADPHVNKYDCQGAVSLSSSMQSNVPSPFSGNHTHLGMPGSQWGQGYKFLSGCLHGSHYLTLRNEYRGLQNLHKEPAPVVRLRAAVVVVVFLCRTVPLFADRGATETLLGERLPAPTVVELGEGG
ncbi:hypothetical protein EVAR_56735_1 [Eumeta japonica]|uniref:Uncharacterized protein n=1 Tax=Eumeta variegata TaxID=151549 RepID=A0A4C1ZRZ1_EUMVA|nr:hypothetical protein EVAR_56735_1 [Eumeta japonica]